MAIIFLPGLIWERIVTKYALKTPPTQFETALRTFTFGLTAYAITYMIFTAAGYEFLIPEVKKDATFIADKRYILEFATACAVAMLGAVLWLYGFTNKWLGRFLRLIKATKKSGDEDIWDYAFNTSDPTVEYVHVRDYTNGKVFAGWVAGFSESDKVRELLLRDVQVYTLESEHLYDVPLVYLGRGAEDISLEFPVRPSSTEQA